MKGVTLSLAVLCLGGRMPIDSSRGIRSAVEEPIELRLPTADASELPTTGEAPERRPARLEAVLIERLDWLESAEREQGTRVAALSEQVERLRAQIAALKEFPPGTSSQGSNPPDAVPTKVPVPSEPTRTTTDRYCDGLPKFDERQYTLARASCRAVMVKNLRGDLADNAQYWLGECEYAEENHTAAIVAFPRVFDLQGPRRMTMPRLSSVTATTAYTTWKVL